MGTNYYLKTYRGERCSHCGRSDNQEILHIGKSSVGWKFVFNPQYGEYPTFADWRRLLEKNPNSIFDEYGKNISLFEFYALIESKKSGKYVNNGEVLDKDGIVRISNNSDFC